MLNSNTPDAPSEAGISGLNPSSKMSTNQTPPVSELALLGNYRTKKLKGITDTDPNQSPASIHSDNSNYSDGYNPIVSRPQIYLSRNMPSNESGKRTISTDDRSSDDNDHDEETFDVVRKREKHTQVEAQRRALEKAHFKELSMLITSENDGKPTKIHHLDLLKIAAAKIAEMNSRYEHEPLRPSNLTDNELKFLTIEASNSFLFVTTIEQSSFRVVHVTDSINRVLNITPNQWLGYNFLHFIHPDDFLRFQNQFMSLNQHVGMRIHLDCRLKKGNSDLYSSVIIDGTTKILDHSLKPLQSNASGFLAFVGICHIPLITKYSETNMSLYKNPNLCILSCRCSPDDWKIFLVDHSVSTLPSIPYASFRQKSVLDFIQNNEREHVHRALLRSLSSLASETITCHFIHPTSQIPIPMQLEIRSFFNPVTNQADFIELTFKKVNNLALFGNMNEQNEIDELLELDSSISTQMGIEPQLNVDSTTQPMSCYYTNDLTTKVNYFKTN